MQKGIGGKSLLPHCNQGCARLGQFIDYKLGVILYHVLNLKMPYGLLF